MHITHLTIEEGDTILSIAKRSGLSVASVIRRHNWTALPEDQIVDFRIPAHLTQLRLTDILEPLTPEEEDRFYIEHITAEAFPFETIARYRCEQLVMTKLNGVVRNHAETKREFLVKKQLLSDGLYVRVELCDNIVVVYPNTMSEAINLLSDLDAIKCNFIARVDLRTGLIESMINHQELVSRWETLKEHLTERYSFLRTPEVQQKLDTFLQVAESQIKDESFLLQDLRTKMFFDLFFDSYLVTDTVDTSAYTRRLYSQLFEGLPVDLDFERSVLTEAPDTITMNKEGQVRRKTYDRGKLESLYDAKYKPMIHYKFSEYDYSYQESCIVDTQARLLNYADVLIKEAVRNNIELITDYKLKRIE